MRGVAEGDGAGDRCNYDQSPSDPKSVTDPCAPNRQAHHFLSIISFSHSGRSPMASQRARSPKRGRQAPPAGSPEVDAYIARCPAELRSTLETLRKLIRSTAPGATEVISYSIPGYGYPGYDFQGMFAWFGLQSNHIGLYLRPPTIENHRAELEGYETTKSSVHLPLDREIPKELVRKLVRASERIMKERSA